MDENLTPEEDLKLYPVIPAPQWVRDNHAKLAEMPPMTKEEHEIERRVSLEFRERLRKTPEKIAFYKEIEEFKRKNAEERREQEAELLRELNGNTNPTEEELFAAAERIMKRKKKEKG